MKSYFLRTSVKFDEASWNEAVIFYEYGLLTMTNFTIKLNTKFRPNPFYSLGGEMYGETELVHFMRFVQNFTHIHIVCSDLTHRPSIHTSQDRSNLHRVTMAIGNSYL
jgi:hypothetical protein